MKFISPSFEILPIPEPTDKMAVLKHLERIGRICYKSEDKITDESCIKFLDNIKKRKHWAMLEHYVFIMEISDKVYSSIYNDMMLFDQIASINHRFKYFRLSTHDGPAGAPINIISGSATTFNYIWECFENAGEWHGILEVCEFLNSQYPEIMMRPARSKKLKLHTGDVKFVLMSEIENLPDKGARLDIKNIHETMSVKFITDRGVSHELVRHRPPSWAQESTRYCNYGNAGCTFIIPGWFSEREHQILEDATMEDIYNIIHPENPYCMDDNVREWVSAMLMANNSYQAMIDRKWTPQQARSVLPISIKTEIIMTANMYEWHHFFDMRADKPAHPQMKELSYPLLKQAYQNNPDLFNDIMRRAILEGEGKR